MVCSGFSVELYGGYTGFFSDIVNRAARSLDRWTGQVQVCALCFV